MKVLIADDEPLARERLARLVSALPGYTVLPDMAANGHEVLELVEKMLGKEHIFYADGLNNLSVDYAGKKEYKKALALNIKALNQK